jgi:cyclase
MAVKLPSLLTKGAERFGSQCIVLAIDGKRRTAGGWEVYTHGGRTPTNIDVIEWAIEGVNAGAGEILLTSMDADGTGDGFDLELTKAITEAVNVPVIASGGAGTPQHFYDVFNQCGADAALAATLFHDDLLGIPELKKFLLERNIPIRPV